MTTWLLRAFGLLLMLTALALPLARAPDRAVETLVARWGAPPSQLDEVAGSLLHWRDEGPRDDRRPLLLLHGTAGSLHDWDAWTQQATRTRRVVRLDLPGAGLSGPPADGEVRSEALARQVLAWMDRLGLRRVQVLGHERGGELAWQLASLAPERVSALVLLDATGFGVAPEIVLPSRDALRLPVLGWLSEQLLMRAWVAAELQTLYAQPERVREADVDRWYELRLRAGNRVALRTWVAQPSATPTLEQLQRLRMPVLLAWGERDRWTPPGIARRYAQQLPGSRLLWLPGLGHLPQMEDPAASWAPVQGWLDGLDSRHEGVPQGGL